MDFKKVKAYVVPVPGREAEIAAIRQIILSQGGELVCQDETDLSGFEDCVTLCDVVVVLICPETKGSPGIERVIRHALENGKRVVGIWLDEKQTEMPAGLERGGDACVAMSDDGIKEAVIFGRSVWQLPTGKKRPEQKTPRHKGH